MLLAATTIRVGLALTFLIYAVFKFTNADEYRIVVAEAPGISLVTAVLGAQTTVNVLGMLELLMAFLMIPGISSWWGALFQAAALSSFALAVGYPFSLPQALGLIGVIGGLVCVQSIRVERRRAGRPWALRPVHSGAQRAQAERVVRTENAA